MHHNDQPHRDLAPGLPLEEIRRRLSARVTPGVWWPAESDFEIMAGAVLTQNTNWTNVERALDNLRDADVLSAESVVGTPTGDLAGLIRPAGYYNIKAVYLKELSSWVVDHGEPAARLDTADLRRELLTVKGVGPETADDILLYVYNRPVFIFDLYARRMLTAAGYRVPGGYESARRALAPVLGVDALPAHEHKHLHGLIVDAGKIARSCGWAQLLAPADSFPPQQ